jgi:hypothetical protein
MPDFYSQLVGCEPVLSRPKGRGIQPVEIKSQKITRQRKSWQGLGPLVPAP